MVKAFIVGISGPQYAGKTTLANLIVDHIAKQCPNGKSFACVRSLAQPIKDIGEIVLGEPVNKKKMYVIDIDGSKSEFTGRQFLQYVGTEMGRHFHQGIWIWRLLRQVQSWVEDTNRSGCVSQNIGGIVFVDDVRFRNEYNVLCNIGIWLEPSVMEEQANNHASEADQEWLKQQAAFRYVRESEDYYKVTESGLVKTSVKEILDDIVSVSIRS